MEETLETILESVCWVMIMILVTVFIIGIVELFDFRNDYYCAKTTDKEWYVKHNCMKYESQE